MLGVIKHTNTNAPEIKLSDGSKQSVESFEVACARQLLNKFDKMKML